MNARLILDSDGPHEPAREFHVDSHGALRIGSSPACDVRIDDDLDIAPCHCEVRHAGGFWQARALEVDLTIRINGEVVDDGPLVDGDELIVGNTSFRFAGSQGAAVPRRRLSKARPKRRPRPAALRHASPVAAGPAAGPSSEPRAPVPAAAAAPRRRRRLARGSPVAAILLAAGAAVFAIFVVAGLLREAPAPEDPRVARAPQPDAAPPARSGIAPRAAPKSRPAAAGRAPQGDRAGIDARGGNGDDRGDGDDASNDDADDGMLEAADDDADIDVIDDAIDGGATAAGKAAGAAPPQEPTAAAARALEVAAALEAVREGLLEDLACLEVERARTRAKEALDPFDASAEVAALAARADAIASAWNAIADALARAARERASLEAAATRRPLDRALAVQRGAARKGRAEAFDGHSVTLRPSAGKPSERYSVLALADEALVDLAAARRRDDPQALAAAIASCGLIRLAVEGPDRARALLLDPRLDAATLEDHARLLEREASAWLPRKLRALRGRGARLAAGEAGDSGPAGRGWLALADAYLELILSIGHTAEDFELRDELRDGFLAAEERAIRLGEIFRAARIEEKDGGRVALAYDFSTPEQTADFLPTGAGDNRIEVRGGRARLQGEFRFRRGDPFAVELAARVQAQGFETDAPNINVALWTAETDALTFRDGKSTQWLQVLQNPQGEPADWFVFGVGYRTVVYTILEDIREELTLVENKATVPFPAFVVIAGQRSTTLHRDLGEGLWAQTLDKPPRGALDVLVDWRDDAVRFSVNGKELAIGTALVRERAARVSPRRGSVTILTNDRPVVLSEIVIEGILDVDWIAERRRTDARAHLMQAAPEFVFQ